ncbi:MAG: transporter substrate-binding domain-containing protein [Alphaproteobacteria bacterium]
MVNTLRGFGLLAGLFLALAAMVSITSVQAQESTWEAIKDRGSIRLGATQAPPWYFKDPQSGEWSGFGVSVGKQMADTLDVDLEVVEVTWGTAIAALQADKIDIMFVLDATPERALAVDFPATPLLYYALAVLHDDDLDVKGWEDLNKPDITVSVMQGTTIDSFVSAKLPEANVLRFPTNSETVAAYQSGRADVASMFHPPLIALQKKVGRGKITLPTPIRASASSAAIRKEEDKRWRDWVGTAISYYYDTGQTQVWYEEFLNDFGMDPGAVPPIIKELWPR